MKRRERKRESERKKERERENPCRKLERWRESDQATGFAWKCGLWQSESHCSATWRQPRSTERFNGTEELIQHLAIFFLWNWPSERDSSRDPFEGEMISGMRCDAILHVLIFFRMFFPQVDALLFEYIFEYIILWNISFSIVVCQFILPKI